MKIRNTIALVLGAAMFCACCNCQQPSNATLDKLTKVIAEGKYMYAHQDDLCYGHEWKYVDGESDVKAVCGDYPAIVGFDLGGIELADSANLDGVPFEYMRKAAQDHVQRGGIVTFSWHPRNPLTGGSAWDVETNGVVTSILPEGENYEKFMGWLSNAADFLLSVKDAEGNPIQAIFRPWHENVPRGWFWWGQGHCTADEFKTLWKITYDYMVGERGLTNLVWAYSPNFDAVISNYMETYPGDDMVDILGVDIYQFGDAAQYIDYMNQSLNFIEEQAAEHGKICAVTEAGYEGIKDATWWTNVLDKSLQGHKISYVLTWRNAWDRPTHFYGPYPGAECEADFKAFHALENTLFLEDIK